MNNLTNIRCNNYNEEKGYYSIKEVSVLYNISKETVRRLVNEKKIDSIKFGGQYRIAKKDLEQYIQDRLILIDLNARKSVLEKLSATGIFGSRLTFKEEEPGMPKKKRVRNSANLKGRKGYFTLRKQVKGKRYTVYHGRSEEEAKKALAKFELQVLIGDLPIPENVQLFENNNNLAFWEYSKKYLEQIRIRRYKSFKDYKVRVKALMKFFKNYKLKDITYAKIKEYQAYRIKHFSKTTKEKNGEWRKISPSTVNREVTMMSGVLSEAMRDGLIDRHPIIGMKLKLDESRKEIHPITEYEKIDEFINCFEGNVKNIVAFGFYTGLRLKNICWLKKTDFNPERNEITVLKQHAKNKKDMIFPLMQQAVELLKSIKNDSVYFFPNPKTCKPYGDFRGTFNKAVVKAGLHPDTTFHDIRRTFGTNLVRNGVPLKVVSRLMGHGSIQVTERYLRISEDEDLRPALDIYAKKLKDIGKKW